MHLQILDLDGSLQSQSALRDAAPWSSVTTVNLRDLGPKVRLWSRDETMRRVRERLPAQDEPTLSLLGSGDFHHVALLLMETSTTPMTIVHIDNHADWVQTGTALALRIVGKSGASIAECRQSHHARALQRRSRQTRRQRRQCGGVGVGEDRPFSVESRALTDLPPHSRRCGPPL